MTGALTKSIIFRIGLLLCLISLLAVLSMASTVYISDSAKTDAYAVNLSGTLRMQSYRLLSQSIESNRSESLQPYINQFELTLNDPVIQKATEANEADEQYNAVAQHWRQRVKPLLVRNTLNENQQQQLKQAIEQQVNRLHRLVEAYQRHAEHNNAVIRNIQGGALLLTALFIVLAMFIIYNAIRRPLNELTQVARQIGRGDFTGQAPEDGEGELAILGRTINKMSRAISQSQWRMEQRVQQKTAQLKRMNESIQLLYQISTALNQSGDDTLNFAPYLRQLADITGLDNLELCLMTKDGSTPYEHLMTKDKVLPQKCIDKECSNCIDPSQSRPNLHTYALIYNQEHFGILNCSVRSGYAIESWQHQLIQSVAEQFAMILSLRHQQHESRRLALVQERTVIARELHDSLAQALSYLKIQVSVLQTSLQDPNKGLDPQDTIEDIKSALNGAYRELRELLTTFRLKMDSDNLHNALKDSIEQFRQRAPEITLDYDIHADEIPFAPNEQVHLLQIAREALQNAINHSGGDHIQVALHQINTTVLLTIKDNGIGINNAPHKRNHYGMAIMQERSHNLNGQLEHRSPPEGGTEVRFYFQPQYFSASSDGMTSQTQ